MAVLAGDGKVTAVLTADADDGGQDQALLGTYAYDGSSRSNADA